MAKSPQDKLAQKKRQWVDRTAQILHVSEETARHLLETKRQQSIRINPLKADTAKAVQELKDLGWSGETYSWFKHGLTIDGGLEDVLKSELATNGSIYVQNAASWLPVLVLDPQPEELVLDVCAAPGGKTSHIAAHAGNDAYVTANDNSRPRLARTKANLERLNVSNVDFTLFDASQLARKFDGRQFDKILLDAPCSGEGMMTLGSDKDFESWSVAHIKRLQQLQRRMIAQTWQLLKPGGTLVYSTCTMAPEENEAVVDYLLRHNDDVEPQIIKLDLQNRVPAVLEWNTKKYDPRLQFAMRLIPSKEIEAFFVCKLVKTIV